MNERGSPGRERGCGECAGLWMCQRRITSAGWNDEIRRVSDAAACGNGKWGEAAAGEAGRSGCDGKGKRARAQQDGRTREREAEWEEVKSSE